MSIKFDISKEKQIFPKKDPIADKGSLKCLIANDDMIQL